MDIAAIKPFTVNAVMRTVSSTPCWAAWREKREERREESESERECVCVCVCVCAVSAREGERARESVCVHKKERWMLDDPINLINQSSSSSS